MLVGNFIALVSFLIGLILLAGLRGEIFSMQQLMAHSDSLQSQIKNVDGFYNSISNNMVWLIISLAIAGALSCSIWLHQSIKRLNVSGPTLRRFKRLRELREENATISKQIIESQHFVNKGMEEFEAGFISGSDPSKRNWEAMLLSPQSIILIVILAILFIMLSKGVARGATQESVCVLLDLSKSSLSQNYQGEKEFQKNLDLVQELIKTLNPGTHFIAIGITENSFSAPYIIIDKNIPEEKGFFGETLAKAKLDLLNTWSKLEITASSNATDILGAINLASHFLGQGSEKKKLIILSDMRECLRYNLEKMSTIDVKILIDIQKQNLIPSLKGVSVYILGVHTNRITESYWNSLRAFWIEFFKKTGANVCAYSVDRRL
jgi:hypothetical protein